MEPVSIQIPYRPLQVALMKTGGTNLIDVKVKKDTHTVLAREVQRDVLRGDILHVDFFAVDLTAKVIISVPVVLVGESPAAAARIGFLLTGTSMLDIETLPTNLMSQIEVDISSLDELGAAIHVSDLDLGPDVTIMNDPEEMLARISQASADRALEDEEAEEEEVEEVDAEVEVIQRGKAEEDEEV
jgi:large subunit ribosomal protein L25